MQQIYSMGNTIGYILFYRKKWLGGGLQGEERGYIGFLVVGWYWLIGGNRD